MRRSFLALALMLVALCGCARHYVITLDNGSRLSTSGKPQLKGGFYIFKDAMGRESYISAARVAELAPASMSGTASSYRPTPQR